MHRDVSPQNVIVTFTGDVKVVDFGIAKAARAGEESPEAVLAGAVSGEYQSENHTKVGQLKGKVPYMSPRAEARAAKASTDVAISFRSA